MNTSLSNHRQNIEFFKYLCQSIKRYIHLTQSEAAAINTHMGVQGNDYSCYNVYREYPLAMLLHTADMIAICPKLRMFNE